MPTKEDIARVATLVINLENKVDNIEEFLEDKVVSRTSSYIKARCYESKTRYSHIRNES